MPAYGIADAEHLVTKELLARLPNAEVGVLEISRTGVGRIVEEFDVAYVVEQEVELEAASRAEAHRNALRQARKLTMGTRYEKIAWAVR